MVKVAYTIPDGTNGYYDEWPEELQVLPQRGDYIKSNRGAILKVVKLVHSESYVDIVLAEGVSS